MNLRDLKIGFFPVHSFAKPGGVKNHVLALHREFKKGGIQSKIIVPRRYPRERYDRDVKLFGASFPIPFNGAQADFTMCLTPGSIAKLLEEEKFDILHFHNFGLHSWQILVRSQATNIMTFHSCLDCQKNKFFKAFPTIIKLFKKSVNEHMAGIIGVAPFNLDLFDDFSGDKAVIPNGIDLENFGPNVPKIKKYLDGKINLLFLGRIEERKGLIYLLRAYRILKKKFVNLRLIVVGEGGLKEDCQEWAREHKLKDVIFEGKIDDEMVPSYYATGDIFISPSTFGESFGIVLLEAMASMKPVVAFANRGYRLVLRGKGQEFLVKPKDWRGLAKKIEILIQDEAKRKELGLWGWREAQKYSWDIIADQVLDFYQKILKHKNRN